ncbi:hemolysin family protein [Rhodococcus aerolatus]
MLTEWLLLAVAVALVAANSLFVAAEFSMVTADRAAVERAAEGGDRRAASLRTALRSMSTQLSGSQLGITVSSLVVGALAEPSLARLLRTPLGLLGLGGGAVVTVSVVVAVTVATAFQAVLGELVPKNWAIAEPLRVGRVVIGAQRAFTAVTRPVIAVLNGSANALLRAGGIEPREELASARSHQELGSLAARSGSEGTLDARTAELVERATKFSSRTAADVMTPRARVRTLGVDDTAEAVIALSARTGFARFPVLRHGVDDVRGVIHFKHALAVPEAERATRTVGELATVVPVAPATMPLDGLLRELRASPTQCALVVDEYGGTHGLATLEDLVEEIVGEIQDEQDRPLSRVRELEDGGWSLSGLLRPDEVEDLTGLELPEPAETDTLAGLLTERLERLAQVDDEVEVDARDTVGTDEDGLPTPVRVGLRVTRLDGLRVDRVRLDRRGTPTDGATADGEQA